ncbi:zinc-finger protein [Skermanella stibiiresistens SB22]|uniref:Zinc-finger protein n=1 Tax=Skermanella stibiiresistens SB22 TaxID=1385369 RepID=W9H1Z7_9PROT|nr:zinc-finger protein [Skermanella stibiiresistens SB22]
MLRGIRKRCPQCGESHIFSRYVTVNPTCRHCGLDISAYRADDAPPYFTIFVVGHIVIPGMLLLEQNFHPASWVHMATWVPMTLLLTLALLPPIKGAVIGAQWALRMKS